MISLGTNCLYAVLSLSEIKLATFASSRTNSISGVLSKSSSTMIFWIAFFPLNIMSRGPRRLINSYVYAIHKLISIALTNPNRVSINLEELWCYVHWISNDELTLDRISQKTICRTRTSNEPDTSMATVRASSSAGLEFSQEGQWTLPSRQDSIVAVTRLVQGTQLKPCSCTS